MSWMHETMVGMWYPQQSEIKPIKKEQLSNPLIEIENLKEQLRTAILKKHETKEIKINSPYNPSSTFWGYAPLGGKLFVRFSDRTVLFDATGLDQIEKNRRGMYSIPGKVIDQ